MGTNSRRALIGVTVLALFTGVTSAVVAASQSSDEAALQPARQAADRGIEGRVNALIARMTVDEKLQ